MARSAVLSNGKSIFIKKKHRAPIYILYVRHLEKKSITKYQKWFTGEILTPDMKKLHDLSWDLIKAYENSKLVATKKNNNILYYSFLYGIDIEHSLWKNQRDVNISPDIRDIFNANILKTFEARLTTYTN